jgi:hypothetical protein
MIPVTLTAAIIERHEKISETRKKSADVSELFLCMGEKFLQFEFFLCSRPC